MRRLRSWWQRLARSAPLTPVDDERERAERHAEAERTGGR